jgi:hypothetical protein
MELLTSFGLAVNGTIDKLHLADATVRQRAYPGLGDAWAAHCGEAEIFPTPALTEANMGYEGI